MNLRKANPLKRIEVRVLGAATVCYGLLWAIAIDVTEQDGNFVSEDWPRLHPPLLELNLVL